VNFESLSRFSSEQRRGFLLIAFAALALSLFYISVAHGHPLAPAINSAPEKPLDPLSVLSPNPTPSPSVNNVVVVDVAGKVVHPGVYKLASGLRVIDAISAAGGAQKGVDLSDINLAEVLTDAQQILVGANTLQNPAPTPRGKNSSRGSHFPIHLNSASASQLDQLPGIGPVMASRIVEYRKVNGAFSQVEQLRKVKGMGSAKFEEIKSLIVL